MSLSNKLYDVITLNPKKQKSRIDWYDGDPIPSIKDVDCWLCFVKSGLNRKSFGLLVYATGEDVKIVGACFKHRKYPAKICITNKQVKRKILGLTSKHREAWINRVMST